MTAMISALAPGGFMVPMTPPLSGLQELYLQPPAEEKSVVTRIAAVTEPEFTEASRYRWNLRRPAGHLRQDGASPNGALRHEAW